ncbi:hypothetical protein DSM3645_03593 [Blastopirellula marina DSM 3645]|uniref:Uncharacterized protein n=1 Tax=Blastopirellula marina DSM 3645 TaxID=314230 RepID=A3ZW32_9BACT|nr:hypothetical protein DSM3645_03593 [Blastopirellula marina DSM 3645]
MTLGRPTRARRFARKIRPTAHASFARSITAREAKFSCSPAATSNRAIGFMRPGPICS